MKRLLILLLVLVNLSAFGQTTVTADRIVANRGFYLKDRWVDSIGVDTTMSGEIRSLPSSDAVYRLIHGRLTNLSIPYSAITGKPDLVLQATLDDSTSVLRDSINALRADIASGGGGASLPSQTGNAGKYLTTDGSTASWASSYKAFQTATDGATVTFDMSLTDNWQVTIAGNRTFSFTNASNGQFLTLKLTQDATGSREPVWPANFKWIGATAPNFTDTGGTTDIVTAVYDGTNWWANYGKNYN